MFRYRAFGLTFEVPFFCPGLVEAPDGASVDVVAQPAELPVSLPAPEARDRMWDMAPGKFLIRGGRNAGRFLVTEGESVEFHRGPTTDEAMLGVRFVGMVLPAIMRQRGNLVLHANAAASPSGALVIAGAAGAGKSTTLSALTARGCPMLSDDVTVMSRRDDGRFEVLPGVARIHLTADSVKGLDIDVSESAPQAWRSFKHAVEPVSGLAAEALPLATIAVINTGPADAEIGSVRLLNSAAFGAVQRNLYGPHSAAEHAKLISMLTDAIAQAEVIRVRRPAGRWTAPAIVDLLLGAGSTA